MYSFLIIFSGDGQFLTDKGLDTELNINGDLSEETNQNEFEPLNEKNIPFESEVAKIITDSIVSEIIKTDSITGNLNINLDEIFTGNGNLRIRLSLTADILEKALVNEKNPI